METNNTSVNSKAQSFHASVGFQSCLVGGRNQSRFLCFILIGDEEETRSDQSCGHEEGTILELSYQ